jgi:hypothetical protein
VTSKLTTALLMALPLVLTAGFPGVQPAAAYSFWNGSNMTQESMENPHEPSGPPLVTRPGLTTDQARQIVSAVGPVMADSFFSMLFFTNNPNNDAYTTIWNNAKTWDGYTLLTVLHGWQPDGEGGPIYGAILIDMQGNIVHTWESTGFPVKLLPNGSLLGGKGTSRELIGFPYLVQQDWCGNEEWKWKGAVQHAWQATGDWFAPPDNGRCENPYDDGAYSEANKLGCNNAVGAGDYIVSGWHHDFQREGNPVGYYFPGAKRTRTYHGKTLILSHYSPPLSETCPHPEACISNYRLNDDAIYIVDWQRNIEFEWFPHQHFDQLGFLPEAREAIRETKMITTPHENSTDYTHGNAVSWVGKNKWWNSGDQRFNPEYIIWDARSSNITAIIATSDHPKGAWKTGDIVWKIGPNYRIPYDPESKLGQIIGQHMAHIIPQGLPGAGNVLLFDNGGGAGWGPLFAGAPLFYDPASPLEDASRQALYSAYRNFSRVIEFNPVTLDIVWEYSQPDPTTDLNGDGQYRGNERFFYSFFISGAQRLPNGNTLITEGATGRIIEVTKEKDVVWEYIWREPEGPGSPGIPLFIGGVYRAYRVPYNWAPGKITCRLEVPGAGSKKHDGSEDNFPGNAPKRWHHGSEDGKGPGNWRHRE